MQKRGCSMTETEQAFDAIVLNKNNFKLVWNVNDLIGKTSF